MPPVFSIVIPVYNVAPYLRKCLDSVFAAVDAFGKTGRNAPPVEVICVDDGSTDGSGAILDEYREKVKARGEGEGSTSLPIANRQLNFRVIHQANAGVSAARNAALEVATGEWVQFLDSDDSIAGDFLVKLAAAIAANPGVDAIEHTAVYCHDDGRREYGDKGRLPPAGVVDAQEILSDPYGKRLTTLGRCSCYKIFRRDVLERHRLRFTPGIPVGEDSLFATQFYACAGKIAICPDIAGYLRIFREGSALMSIKPEKLIPQIRGAEVLYQTWRRRPSPGLARSLSAAFLALVFLGKHYGAETRSACIDAVLASRCFRVTGLWFLLFHGTRKMRLFAAVMLMAPGCLRRRIVERM